MIVSNSSLTIAVNPTLPLWVKITSSFFENPILNVLRNLKIIHPQLSEQQKIASILSNIDSKITSQEQYKEKLLLLKKSLMQKLLTGEVRVKV